MTLPAVMASPKVDNLLTHTGIKSDFDLDAHRQRLTRSRQDSLTLPLEEKLALLDQISQFELGRFLLQNKGLNGYWTAYLILHGPQKPDLSPLEKWLLTSAPTVNATRERFHIFRRELQHYVKAGATLASIPCGLMDDLLGLDFSGVDEPINLVGIDLDEGSLKLARENARKHGLENTTFNQKDAWRLDVKEAYDVITSNGLNIYQPDDEKVETLYGEFYYALKLNGILITSFLMPPPTLSPESTWKIVDPEAIKKQKAIFSDIIGVSWQTFRTEAQTRAQLEKAGFKVLKIIYDSQGLFPTIVALKQ